eukprot:m.154948 g.154948  ORF g.154948 m.154948 type:complete len:120 (+) comp16264_c1_seq5:691-1050(+)
MRSLLFLDLSWMWTRASTPMQRHSSNQQADGRRSSWKHFDVPLNWLLLVTTLSFASQLQGLALAIYIFGSTNVQSITSRTPSVLNSRNYKLLLSKIETTKEEQHHRKARKKNHFEYITN